MAKNTQVRQDQVVISKNTPIRHQIGSIGELLKLLYGNRKITIYNFAGYRIDPILILNAPLIDTLEQIKDGLLFYEYNDPKG